jgi:hypothetical protein
MKKLTLALLALATLGTLSLPAHADDVKMQTSTQVNTQEGEGNISVQRTRQEIEDSRSYSNQPANADSTGHVQDAYQDSLQRGIGNRSYQRTQQQIRSNRNMSTVTTESTISQ